MSATQTVVPDTEGGRRVHTFLHPSARLAHSQVAHDPQIYRGETRGETATQDGSVAVSPFRGMHAGVIGAETFGRSPTGGLFWKL